MAIEKVNIDQERGDRVGFMKHEMQRIGIRGQIFYELGTKP